MARGLCRPPRHLTWRATSARVRCGLAAVGSGGLIGAIATEARSPRRIESQAPRTGSERNSFPAMAGLLSQLGQRLALEARFLCRVADPLCDGLDAPCQVAGLR